MIIWLIWCWLFPALNSIIYTSTVTGHERWDTGCGLRIFCRKNLKPLGERGGVWGPGPRCCGEEERSQTETITASLARHRPPTHNPQPILSIRLGDLETITTSNQGNQAGIILLPSPSVKSFREVRQKFGSQKVFGCEYIFSNCLDIYQQYKGWSPQ